VLGLITGGGDPGKLFGADWSSVSWGDVAIMLLIVGIMAAALVPLAWFVLPARMKKMGAWFMAVAVVAPLGLIAPGFAYGEGSVEDVSQAFGYVPKGLQDLSGLFSAPFSGYNLPFGFFNGSNGQLWKAAIGYEISGMVGMLLVGLIVYGLAGLIARTRRSPGPDHTVSQPNSTPEVQI
jgi:hypothetical protein